MKRETKVTANGHPEGLKCRGDASGIPCGRPSATEGPCGEEDGITEKPVCSLCREEIGEEIYTDRFYEYLCLRCLLRIHRV